MEREDDNASYISKRAWKESEMRDKAIPLGRCRRCSVLMKQPRALEVVLIEETGENKDGFSARLQIIVV